MAALCYADKFVTERTDDVSEVLIEILGMRRMRVLLSHVLFFSFFRYCWFEFLSIRVSELDMALIR